MSTNYALERRLKIKLNPHFIQPHGATKLQHSEPIDVSPKAFASQDRHTDAVCQVFLERNPENWEALGSGVLLRIDGMPFFLTAAHVVDKDSEGRLWVCSSQNMTSLSGYQVKTNLPLSGDREDDKYDIAYYRLSDLCDASLKEDGAVFLGIHALDLGSESLPDECYMFAGFPWRKTETHTGRIESSLCTLAGTTLSSSEVSKRGYKPTDHIVIHFRRDRSAPLRSDEIRVAPLPHGMSGGAIFRPSDLKLAGIGTEYDSKSHLLIGTRLHCFMRYMKQTLGQRGSVR